MKSTSS